MTTDNTQQSKTTESVLHDLKFLTNMFNHESKAKANVTETLKSAATALEAEQAKVTELETQLLMTKYKDDVFKTAKNKYFTFLVDASGSRQATLPLTTRHLSNFSEKTSAQASVVFWSSAGTVSASLAEEISQDTISAIKNLTSGSRFAPAIGNLPASTKKEHYVSIGDGQVDDEDSSFIVTRNFLQENPKATMDFLIEKESYQKDARVWLAQALKVQFPNRVGYQLLSKDVSLQEALANIVKLRTAPIPRKKLDLQP